MKIKSSKPVSVSEAKDILAERGKDGELGYEQSQALEYSEKFARLETGKIKKLIEKLTKNEKINEELAIKIIDVYPKDPSTLKAILVKDRAELSDEEIAQVIKELE